MQTEQYYIQLHPNHLLTISKLLTGSNNKKQANNKFNTKYIAYENITGEVYIAENNSTEVDSINIFKENLDSMDIDKIFTLPEADIARLLETRGFKKARDISKEITKIKTDKINKKRSVIKIIK